jgi:hypothetical protein
MHDVDLPNKHNHTSIINSKVNKIGLKGPLSSNLSKMSIVNKEKWKFM